jgi:MFS transporter, FHS family, glucose/mannose:H+ symporter
MQSTEFTLSRSSARTLTLAAHAVFWPIGIVTVLLSPLLPTLSARWSLSYSEAGALFTAQFLASTIAVAFSGWLITRWGFRFAMSAGLVVIAASVILLLAGSRVLGYICIAGYGSGLGFAVPAANLLVAEVNPARRSAALNLLNFSWSVGAVACPFLIAAAAKAKHIPFLLALVAGFCLLVAIGIAVMPSSIEEPRAADSKTDALPIDWKRRSLPVLLALFFLYVGTENAFGGWVASYAASLRTMSLAMAVMTPSFFYVALMIGRWLATFLLRKIHDLPMAKSGLVLACAGMAGLMASHSLLGVAVSASIAGFGLSSVYPITISFLSREFGPNASRVGSVAFSVANIGGASMPWLVGVFSGHFGGLKVGLAVPLMGSAVMYLLYGADWHSVDAPQHEAV